MSLQVRCLLCCKTFTISKNDTSALLLHIRQSHPEVSDASHTKQQQKTLFGKVKSNESVALSSDLDTCTQKKHIKEKVDKSPDRWESKTYAEKPETLRGKKFCCFPRRPPKRKSRGSRSELNKCQTMKDDMLLSSSAYQIARPKPVEKLSSAYQIARPKPVEKQPAPTKKDDIPECPCAIPQVPCIAKSESGTKILYTRKYKVKSPLHSKAPGKKKLYKTSIEKWRPGQGTIYCPQCGANKPPLIKSHADRVSPSSFGAACILSCWPCCFLPCIFPTPVSEYLHCSVCNHFLGIYDKKKAVIQPNEVDISNKTMSDIHIVQTMVTDESKDQL